MKASPLAHLSKWRRLAPAVALLVVAFALVVGPVSQALAQDGPQAFAVYTADNTTLTLYKAEEVPSVGDTYEGHVVTNVFTIDESDTYFGESPFADVANVVKNVEVADCGENKITPLSMDHWFDGFVNLVEVDGWEYADTSRVTNMSYMFSFTNLSGGLSAPELNTSSVTNMSNMFSYNKGLKTPDFSHWDVSKVTDMSYMFNNCTALSAPNFSNWNPSSVTTMKQMFYQCTALTSLDFSGWNTPDLTNLNQAFFQDAALTSLNFEDWSAPKISNLQSTFNQCSALTELDLSSWGASKVTDTSSTFLGCTSLATLDLSGIGANGKYGYTFDRCPALSKVTLGAGWSFGDTRSLLPETAGKLWYKADADGNPTGDGYTSDELAAAWDGATMAGTWVLGNAPAAELEAFAVYSSTDNTLTLYKASNKPTEGGVYNNKAATRVFDIDEQATHFSASPFADVKDQVTKVIIAAPESADNKLTPKSMNRWFYDFTTLEQVDGWANADTSQVTDMSYMFYRCNLSKGLDAPNLNTSSVTDMSNMFYGCKGLSSATGPDLSSWDVSNVTDMSSMFRECTALQAPKTSGWNTSSVENMSDMFRGCSSIVTFDLTPWNLGNVEFANRMFSGCSKLTTITLPNENMTALTSANELFNGCSSLTTVNASTWVAPALTSASNMFFGCRALTSLDLSSLGSIALKDTDAMFCGCRALATLDLSDIGIAENPIMSAMFTGCSALSKVTLGADWSFADVRGALPSVEGKLWYKADENGDPTGTGYTGKDLAEAWDGDAMCGTWVLSEPIAEPVVPEAFAIYDSSDKSLTIYKASDKPEVGETYNGKTVSYVFTIDETKTNYSTSPFSGYAREYESVVFAAPEYADDKIAPASMSNWFSGFENAKSITGWENVDGSNIQSMSRAFEHCYALTSIDLSDLRLTKATDLSWLFSGCTSLESADLTGLVRSGVTTITYMFNSCSALTELNLLSWNTSGITANNANWMFNGVTSLEKVTLGDRFDFVEGYGVSLPDAAGKLWYLTDDNGDPTGAGYTGEDLAAAWNGDTMCGTWVLSEPIAESGPEAFAVYCEVDKTLTIYKASDKPEVGDTYNGKTVSRVFGINETADWFSQTPFYSAKDSIEKVIFAEPEDQNNKIAPVSMRKWFDSVNRLKSIEGWENVDSSNLTDMSYLFYGTRLESIDLSALKAPKLETIKSMFGSCLELKTANLSGLVTASTTDASNLFLGCSNLESVDVSKWDTSGMKSMTSVFQRCRDLTGLDLSSWTTTDAVNMKWMFNESGITKVTLGTGFSFGSSPSQTSLPDAEDCLWYKLDDSGSPVRPGYTGEELATSWDGSTMAGTWQLTTELEEPEPEPVELAGLAASDSLTYGETLTVTFTPKSGDDVVASGTATLKLGDKVLATSSEPQTDGSFSLSYNTADKGVALGEQTLTVTFESTGYETATGTVETTLSAKALTVEVTSSLDKTWDGSDEVDGLAVELLGALEDDDVTVSATGAYASSDAGEQDVTLTLALSGDDAAWYTVSAPTDLTGTINAADIAGKLSLSGTSAFGETLTATYEPTSGEQVSYTWTRDGQVIDGATGSTYTLAKEDVGAQIAVVATASDANHTGSVTSDAVTVAKATQDAPAAPVGTATSHTTIEVEALADSPAGAKAEYSIDGGKTWQTETTFSGLEPETEYTVIARFQELDTHEASEVSEGTTVSTPAAPLPTFTVSVSAEGQGTVDGGGTYEQGTSVTVTATAAEGHHFVAWLVDGEQVSTEASYTFVVEADVALVAQFEQDETDTPDPDDPDTPDPDDPDTPDTPDPEEPDKPDTPDPDKPADTKPGEQPKPEIPATGDAGAAASFVTALVGAGALGLGAYRRRS